MILVSILLWNVGKESNAKKLFTFCIFIKGAKVVGEERRVLPKMENRVIARLSPCYNELLFENGP